LDNKKKVSTFAPAFEKHTCGVKRLKAPVNFFCLAIAGMKTLIYLCSPFCSQENATPPGTKNREIQPASSEGVKDTETLFEMMQ
jgi:hypothetical protein